MRRYFVILGNITAKRYGEALSEARRKFGRENLRVVRIQFADHISETRLLYDLERQAAVSRSLIATSGNSLIYVATEDIVAVVATEAYFHHADYPFDNPKPYPNLSERWVLRPNSQLERV